MKKKSIRIKKILFKVFLIALIVSLPVNELILFAFELPLYLKVIFCIYLIIMFALLECICDALFPESEHTEEERKTEVNIEESKNQPKERTE